MSAHPSGRRGAAAAVVVAGLTTSVFAGGALFGMPAAHADTDQPGMPPDVSAYCMTHTQYGLQQQPGSDWQVAFNKVTGTPGKNNWACHYYVEPTVPAGEDSFTSPVPVDTTVPVDFKKVCDWQYPGSHPEWSTAKNDWTCIGKSGTQYDMTQHRDGTTHVEGGYH